MSELIAEGLARANLLTPKGVKEGLAALPRDVQFDGMTDRAIVRAGLASLGESVTDEAMRTILADYVPLLRRTRRRGRVPLPLEL